MELTAAGYYVIPRYMGWEEFLTHTRAVLDCGNHMYIQFSSEEGPFLVTDFRKLYDTGKDNSYLFTIANAMHTHTLIENITEFKFIQFRPNTEWNAIHMGSTKRFNLQQFIELWENSTFSYLKPVIILHEEKFWPVMGIKLEVEDGDVDWCLYLKRQDSDYMTKVKVAHNQKFLYNPISGSWCIDDPTTEITDLEEIKKSLKAEGVLDMVVSGVPMRLVRVQEIAKGVLFFVFQDEEKNKRYYYARRTTKLRIVTDQETGEVKYLLDHVKAMHID